MGVGLNPWRPWEGGPQFPCQNTPLPQLQPWQPLARAKLEDGSHTQGCPTLDLRGIPGVGREGLVNSFWARCIPRMLLWLAGSGKIRYHKYSEET